MRLINYDNNGKVMVYHTIPRESGNSNEFEHKAMVSIRDAIKYGRRQRRDDPTRMVEDVTMITVECPGTVRVAKRDDLGDEVRDNNGSVVYETNFDGSFKRQRCGSVAYVPLTGDSEAQEAHARFRHARGEFRTVEDARAHVITEVTRRGHEARITRNGQPGRGF